MGTCNFHKRFASAYFVVDGKRYFNDAGEELDEWEEGCHVEDDTEFLLEDIVECAKEWGWKPGDKDFLVKKWEDVDLMLGHINIEIQTEIEVNPGYYEACNLDWDIRLHIPGTGYDVHLSDFYNIEDLGDDIYDAFSWYEDVWNEGIKKMQKKNIVKKALDRIREVGLAADEFCKKVCTGVYGVYAHFSNGETWYAKIA